MIKNKVSHREIHIFVCYIQYVIVEPKFIFIYLTVARHFVWLQLTPKSFINFGVECSLQIETGRLNVLEPVTIFSVYLNETLFTHCFGI